jgi:hypothetical protein
MYTDCTVDTYSFLAAETLIGLLLQADLSAADFFPYG